MFSLLSLLLLLVSGVFTSRLRRMATDSFDAFTKPPPVPPLPQLDPVPVSAENDTLVPDSSPKYEIDLSKTPLDLLRDSNVESLTTEPYIFNDDFPEKEQTVTQTDWFNPFTHTPWVNKAGKFYTVDMDNDTEDNGEDDQSSNEAHSSSSYSIFRISRTSLAVMLMVCPVFL